MMKSILTTIALLALAVSGLAQTRSVIVNTSGVVQSPTNFWSADVTNARSGLGLGTAATNAASVFQPSSLALSNLASSNGSALTNLTGSSVTGTVASASNVTGTIAISNGGSGATTAAGARTNFGLGALSANEVGFGNVKMGGVINFIEPIDGAIVFGLYTDTDPVYLNPIHWNDGGVRTALGLGLSVLTNTNTSNFRTAIGLGVTNDVTFGSVTASSIKNSAGTRALDLENFSLTFGTNYVLEWTATEAIFNKPLTFLGTVAATTRTNLGLGWSALTNTSTSGFNASAYGLGTNPVLVNTSGTVVSPTNFWQAAPINTFVQYSQPTGASNNVTNAATNARNLYLYSLTPLVNNVTNTITLPTNADAFLGDVATVIHEGPTNSVTAIRQIGSATNIITIHQFQEAVQFIKNGDGWKLADNISQVEPLYFSGTNAVAHAAESRTNLGLGWLALTNPQSSLYSGQATRLLSYAPEIAGGSTNPTGFNVLAYTNTNSLVIPANILIGEDQTVGGPRNTRNVTVNGSVTIQYPFSSPTTIYGNNSIIATDNSSYTNVIASFGSNSVGFSNITASGTLTATSTITAKTNLVVEGFVDFTTNRTNNSPASGANFSDRSRWLQVKVGTNNFYIPLFQ